MKKIIIAVIVVVLLVAYGFAWGTPDIDEDGLNNFEEVFKYGSNIEWKDSDFDGLDDGEEAKLGTDPKEKDSDSDGIPDIEEIELNFNPILKDSDGNGVDDIDETTKITVSSLERTIHVDIKDLDGIEDVPISEVSDWTESKSSNTTEILFEVDVNTKVSERDKIEIREINDYYHRGPYNRLSRVHKVSLNGNSGVIRVDISDVCDKNPVLHFYTDDRAISKLEGQYIENNVIYGNINLDGYYIVVSE